jgi:hypothetical protein
MTETGTNPLVTWLIPVVGCIAVFASPVAAAFDDDWSNIVENNFSIDGEHLGIGGRVYLNNDTNQFIIRYKFDSRYSSQYRWVHKPGGAVEHWFRLQRKDIAWGRFFWNTRTEYRIREGKSNVFRLRPQTGFKFRSGKKYQPYYKLEPHFEYDFDTNKGYFKFAQHFIGFDYKLNKQVSFGPFIEIDTDADWNKVLTFLGLQIEVKLSKEK